MTITTPRRGYRGTQTNRDMCKGLERAKQCLNVIDIAHDISRGYAT